MKKFQKEKACVKKCQEFRNKTVSNSNKQVEIFSVMYTAGSEFSNLKIEYRGEIKTEIENTLACL